MMKMYRLPKWLGWFDYDVGPPAGTGTQQNKTYVDATLFFFLDGSFF
jgi:hypothetical protein